MTVRPDVSSGDLPYVSAAALRDPAGACPRRTARELDRDVERRQRASSRPYNRARIENVLWDRLYAAHHRPFTLDADLLVAPSTLFGEEQALLTHAFRWYRAFFAAEEVRALPDAVPKQVALPSRGVGLFGPVGFTAEDRAGVPVLRRLQFGAPLRAPEDDPWLKVALLRLLPWLAGRSLRLTLADVLDGARVDVTLDPATAIEPWRDWFDTQVRALHQVADEGATRAGRACATCRFLAGCPAHPGAANGMTARGGLAPGVVVLPASTITLWRECPRRFRNRQLLRLPPSNRDPGPETGTLTHGLLEALYRESADPDEGTVERVMAAAEVHSEPISAMLHAHLRRRPRDAELVGAEITRTRVSGRPAPPFLATARLDAMFEHDGILDVRDYKTGRVWVADVAEDPQARVQAWVTAADATARHLRLQVRFEHLAAVADEEPRIFEPDADDLEAIESELREIASAIRRADANGDYPAAAELETCRPCEFRAICPLSAAPADPTWPTPPEDWPTGP